MLGHSDKFNYSGDHPQQLGSEAGVDADPTTNCNVSIASLYTRCIVSFGRVCSLLSRVSVKGCCDAEHQQILLQRLRDELGKFNVWAGTAGAHRIGEASLDYRLREASHISGQVAGLLEELDKDLQETLEILVDDDPNRGDTLWEVTLQDQLSEGLSSEEEEQTELEGVLADIAHIVRCLYKFSVVVRNPIPRERIQKIATMNISNFEPWGLEYVSQRFPKTPRYFLERMVKANTMRRQLLRYYHDHHYNITQKTPDRDVIHEHDVGIKSFETPIPKGPATISTMLLSQITAPTIHVNALNFTEKSVDDHHLSEASFMFIPTLPNSHAMYGQSFQCPYCFQMIKVENIQAWGNHVLTDLQPYVCTYINCPSSDRLYDRQSDWELHEAQIHRREWFCNECSRSFSTQFRFQEHITTTHSEMLMDNEDVSIVVRRCERPKTASEPCVFCNLSLHHPELSRHLARHMHELSLFLLSEEKLMNEIKEKQKIATDPDRQLTFHSNPDREGATQDGLYMTDSAISTSIKSDQHSSKRATRLPKRVAFQSYPDHESAVQDGTDSAIGTSTKSDQPNSKGLTFRSYLGHESGVRWHMMTDSAGFLSDTPSSWRLPLHSNPYRESATQDGLYMTDSAIGTGIKPDQPSSKRATRLPKSHSYPDRKSAMQDGTDSAIGTSIKSDQPNSKRATRLPKSHSYPDRKSAMQDGTDSAIGTSIKSDQPSPEKPTFRSYLGHGNGVRDGQYMTDSAGFLPSSWRLPLHSYQDLEQDGSDSAIGTSIKSDEPSPASVRSRITSPPSLERSNLHSSIISKGPLERYRLRADHKTSIPPSQDRKKLDCPLTGCPRKGANGFVDKFKLDDHLYIHIESTRKRRPGNSH